MEVIKIINKTELTRVRPEDVLYLKAAGNYTHMVLRTGREFKFTRQIKEFNAIFQQLEDNPFLRVGRSLIVNKSFIFQVNATDQHIILAGNGLNTEVTLTAFREPILELMKQLTNEGGQQ